MNELSLPKRLTPIDTDYARWADEQAALLRAGKYDLLDLQNLAEEVEGLARSDKYELDSRMEVLLQHLLKWQFQPAKRKGAWKGTIVEQRIRIARVISQSPSLRAYPLVNLHGNFVLGRNAAITETRLPESSFPETCPYTIEQILDPDFLPE